MNRNRSCTAAGLALLTAASLGACSGDGVGPDTKDAGIYVVAGGAATDTVGTHLVQALIVEVYSPQKSLAPEGTVVRFTALGGFNPEVLVGRLTGSASSGFTSDSLDASGRAAILVRLGFEAGPARLEISVPIFGMIDTVEYTVVPGMASRITLTPSDTTVYFDASYAITGTVFDAYGNARPDPVAFSVPAGSPVTISPSAVVSPNVAGRHSVTATVQSLTASAMVSALPRFRLVAWRPFPDAAIVAMDVDGSNPTVLAPVADGGIGAHPTWITGTTVAYTTIVGSYQLLRVVDQAGVVSPFIASPPASMTHQAEPTPTASGNFMFFSAFDTRCGGATDYCLFRSGLDGSNPELISAGFARQAGPSPDGSRVAFTTDPFSGAIRVLDVASGTVSAWSVAGQNPRWSPDGSTIAFPQGGRIMRMNPDGSGVVSLTPPSKAFTSGPISWSPDGRWIIARSNVLELIEVATGMTLPLAWSGNFVAPSIR